MHKKYSSEFIKSTRPSVEEVTAGRKFPVSVIAENVRSLYNVGSIFRTSDGASVERLYLTGYTGFPPRKEIDKTALGSVNSVEWIKRDTSIEVIRELKGEGYHIAALEHTDRSIPYTEIEYTFPLCLIVGNEVDGTAGDTIELVDSAIEIPMHGIKQSLNVSVAYGIVIYHIIEQYKKRTPRIP